MNENPAAIVLVNPNSSASTTAAMAKYARASLDASDHHDVELIAVTAQWDCPFITEEWQLERSGTAALEAVRHVWENQRIAACIVGAFGDPGVEQIAEEFHIPTAGLAQASIAEALLLGDRFGIVTTTPGLGPAIERRVSEVGAAHACGGIRFTPGSPDEIMSDYETLVNALVTAARDCVDQDGVDCVIIGGGPLAAVADRLQSQLEFPVIAPVPAAIRQILGRMGKSRE